MKVIDKFMMTIGKQARKPSGRIGKILLGHMAALGHRPLTKWTVDFMDIQPTDYVLDIGCGGGMAAKLITRVASEGFVAGVDYSKDMVQQARKRNSASIQMGYVKIRQGNVASIPYDDESFNKVIAIETFYFWPSPVANLREIRRVMKHGGLLALAMEYGKNAHNELKISKMANKMGFPVYNGDELVEMLPAAEFRRAWFNSQPEKGYGWLCALGTK